MERKSLETWISGEPQPKGSVSAFINKGRAIVTHSQKSKEWEATIRKAIEPPEEPLEGPLGLELWFLS